VSFAGVSALSDLSEEPTLTLEWYQSSANETNIVGDKPVTILLLGLVGEIGSVVSELKKKQREEDAYIGFKDSVLEELGDALWYLTSVSTYSELSLEELAKIGFGEHALAGRSLTFSSVQESIAGVIPTTSRLELTLLKLSSEAGKIIDEFLKSAAINRDRVSFHLAEIFKVLFEVAIQAKVSLAVAAQRNLKKNLDRWPREKKYPELFDSTYEEEEQIPRLIQTTIAEREVGGRTYVYQKCNGLNIGDRITDNMQQEDDYRFHDVFHLGYAAILGWSPVTRALFRVKRKSVPKIDENEDGARAIITEEAISAWIFNHASRLKYFDGLKSIESGLLRAVHSLVRGYEVHSCPLWLWEEAILQGYTVFRELRRHRRGLVIADLTRRKIEFREITNDAK
jgi:NTP pyrophosphatase (non-canonical NTP hydrolase)